jgi:hypothetical protein
VPSSYLSKHVSQSTKFESVSKKDPGERRQERI